MSANANVTIDVHHVTRVEGHGNIRINVRNGVLEECRLDIVESPRFFEAMLKGRPYTEAHHITCRICGICSVGHTLASLQASEAALGVKVSDQTTLLRKIALHGETLQSHVLHAYYLAAPDFVGVGSVLPLAATHLPVVQRALRLKKLANDLCAVVVGRHVHPISTAVGGFTNVPDLKKLREVQARLMAAREDFRETVELFKALAGKIPAFERKTEYISLKRDDEYAYLNGDIFSSQAGRTVSDNYRAMTNEYIVAHSSAKHCKVTMDGYQVGALARFNNNHAQLRPEAQKVAEALGLKAPCHNPYMITVAQVVESVHCLEDVIELIDEVLRRGVKREPISVTPRAGTGVGATEVPRGVLYHEYTYDDQGCIVRANCIIPTGQNLANIENDMRALIPQVLDKTPDEIRLLSEMLVRAYDPCISCSAHFLNVEFVK